MGMLFNSTAATTSRIFAGGGTKHTVNGNVLDDGGSCAQPHDGEESAGRLTIPASPGVGFSTAWGEVGSSDTGDVGVGVSVGASGADVAAAAQQLVSQSSSGNNAGIVGHVWVSLKLRDPSMLLMRVVRQWGMARDEASVEQRRMAQAEAKR